MVGLSMYVPTVAEATAARGASAQSRVSSAAEKARERGGTQAPSGSARAKVEVWRGRVKGGGRCASSCGVRGKSGAVLAIVLKARQGDDPGMDKRTLAQLESALSRAGVDLAARVEELAAKCMAGELTPSERAEFENVVRLNDLLSCTRLQGAG